MPLILTGKTLSTRVRARQDGADEPTIVMPAAPPSGLCGRCGEWKDDTGCYGSDSHGVPPAPFCGRWRRGEEHESMLTISCGPYTLRLGKGLDGGTALEWWLVQSLHLWPHPAAPVEPGEYDYPNYRNLAYARLKAAAHQE